MKIIVCGSGPVGYSIARQLAAEENDVTVIDIKTAQIRDISDSLDVTAFVGFPSHPPVLEEAGAADAQMIIAVTSSDETNMVVTQIAHTLFNIPIKIARIRHKNYLMPIWKDLYRHDHLPIDHIISPEIEVAKAIINRLHVPGAMDSIPFAEDLFKVVEIRCHEECPMKGRTIKDITNELGNVKVNIMGIHRAEELIIPKENETLAVGDELFFVADSEDVHAIMVSFGYGDKEARRVLILGGGNIGLFIAEALEKEANDINTKLIELSTERAEYVASKLPSTTVINGSSLDKDILFESGIEATETVIAVTNDDEVNILSSLLCKRFGAKRAFTLVNKGIAYNPLVSSFGIDVTINPREMTISSVLQHTRRGKVRAAHSICSGRGELLELEVMKHSTIIGNSISDLLLPDGVRVGAILRNEERIIPDDTITFLEKDRIIILSLTSEVRKVDKIFSTRLDYF